jgi:asparagine N-glycosylation enzyme membrane subunit Stt3
MDTDLHHVPPSQTKGTAALLVAVLFVALMLVFFPAARLFIAISIPIGVVVAVGLYFWNKRRPAAIEEQHNKRPLGLE